jgi:hypothetical protein
MLQCAFCNIVKSGGKLLPVWDKHVQAWIPHYVCSKCTKRALECYQRAIDLETKKRKGA